MPPTSVPPHSWRGFAEPLSDGSAFWGQHELLSSSGTGTQRWVWMAVKSLLPPGSWLIDPRIKIGG